MDLLAEGSVLEVGYQVEGSGLEVDSKVEGSEPVTGYLLVINLIYLVDMTLDPKVSVPTTSRIIPNANSKF